MRLGVTSAVVGAELVPGDVELRDGRVHAVGLPAQPGTSEGFALPGLIDVHVNGAAGVDFLTATAEDYEGDVARHLARTGVTAYLPTFVSSPEAATIRALETLTTATSPVRILGAHLEGPFLSTSWAGAHDPRHLREPDRETAERLMASGPVRLMTIAPELPHALELVGHLTRHHGVVVSIGHTDADAATAHAAFDRGATALTHIYNAHRRFQPRDPGPAGVALTRPDVYVMAILDDVHLAPETGQAAFMAARNRFVAVTDAIPTGEHRTSLGGRDVDIAAGAARLPDGTLAGSLLTMDAALRSLLRKGATLPEAAHACSRAPALLIGRPDLGLLEPGSCADITVLDGDMRVVRTLVGGADVAESTPPWKTS